MRFITEMELRVLYNKEPFTIYKIEENTRLTPGARQFLIDRRVVVEEYARDSRDGLKKEQSESKVEKQIYWRNKKLISKMRSVESLFYLTGEEYLHKDILLAEEIIKWGSQLSKIRKGFEKGDSVDGLVLEECSGIDSNNFSNSLEECFDISDFHLRLERGMDIIVLHRLRCVLLEIEPVILELYEYIDGNAQLLEGTMGRINQIVNALSQRICFLVGGRKCQRKI